MSTWIKENLSEQTKNQEFYPKDKTNTIKTKKTKKDKNKIKQKWNKTKTKKQNK